MKENMVKWPEKYGQFRIENNVYINTVLEGKKIVGIHIHGD